MAGPRFQTAVEIDRIRKADAILAEARIKAFVPEESKFYIGLKVEIGRYNQGNALGSFVVFVTETGHKDKRAQVKKLKLNGVDRDSVLGAIDKAMGRRFFK